MESDTAIQLGQQALLQLLMLALPVLVVALVLGILTGIVQTVTQIQDHTLAFVPKLLGILLLIFLLLPWMVESMNDFGSQSLQNINELLTRP